MKSKLTILVLTGLLLSNPILAYDDQTTHSALTDEIVDFYNLFFENKLTNKEKEWIIKGAMDEDTPPRWINHFYDPIYKVGWTGENTGIWPTMLIQYFSGKVLSSANPASSLNWLHNQQLQSEYGEFKGNRAWERAIYEYAKDNKQEAYYTLGYILHLIEDATVPDHTRNDTHAHELQYFTGDYGSPYEEFSKQYARQTLNIVDELKNQGYKPIVFSSIDEYLLNLAEYSNKYFFSKDTINDPKYSEPKIMREENGYGYGKDKNGEEFEVVKVNKFWNNLKMDYEIIYSLKNVEEYHPILSQYFTRLSREAIINGAGVIDLFIREGEKAKQNIDSIEKPPQETQKVSSLIDELYAISNFFSIAKEFAISAIENISSKISPKIVLPESQLAVISPPEETISISDIDQLTVSEPLMFPEEAPRGKSPTLADLSDLQTILDEAKARVAVLEKQVAEIAQARAQSQAQAQQNNNLEAKPPSAVNAANNFAALPYAGFGGGAAPSDAAPTENATNTSSSTSVELFIDSEAPLAPTLSVAECANSLAAVSGACLVATTTLNLNWASAATDLNYFELSYGSPAATTTLTSAATSTVLSLIDNTSYTFFLRARDQSGNWSEATTTAAEISTIPVIINEVAWMGTASSTEDEWIELYNRTNHAVNFNNNNWVLRVSDNRPYIPLSKTIPAKGYYLLERADDRTISDLSADLVYGNDGADWALNNTGTEILILSHSSTTIDRTPSSSWPGGTTASFRTMERYNPDILGEEISNWGTNITIIRNNKDGANNPINGTPKARNSANYLIAKGAATISENIILTKDRSPYVVDNTVQVFQNSAVLTIEPGVTIKFYNDAGMNFNNAAIQAQGATGSPIVFTSFYDDEYGGDTNNDATSSSPSIGDWYGVDIIFGSSGSVLDYAVFRYGGKYYSPASEADRVIVKIENTPDISVKNSVFEYSRAHGLVLINSTSTVQNSIFRNNNNYSEQGKGLFVAGSGNYSIKNNEFSQNQTGLYLSDAAAIVDTNTFSNNTQKAVYSYGLLGKFTNNNASQNGKNGIVLGGNLAATGSTSTLKADNIAYVFSEENPVVPANSALAVESGAIIKGSGNGLQVNGRLTLNGENSGDIILTSLYDDTIGGDTDNSVNSPGPGNWPGINLASNASFQGKGFTMRYAGSQSSNGNDSAGLKITAGSANIANALFDANYPYGLFTANASNLAISNSRFENHNYSGPWGIKAALAVFDSAANLNSVSFINNLLGIASDAVSTWIASSVEFINNTATTSPGGLF